MKISYILQLKDFCIMFGVGFLVALFYGIINIFPRIKKCLAIQIPIDVCFCIASFITFILMINLINMGEFRFFLLAGFVIGFLLERITLGKLFAKLFKMLYNNIAKLLKKFASSRLGRIVLK
jgi:hypothetical protein